MLHSGGKSPSLNGRQDNIEDEHMLNERITVVLRQCLLCPMCQRPLENNPTVVDTCGHAFCYHCIHHGVEHGCYPLTVSTEEDMQLSEEGNSVNCSDSSTKGTTSPGGGRKGGKSIPVKAAKSREKKLRKIQFQCPVCRVPAHKWNLVRVPLLRELVAEVKKFDVLTPMLQALSHSTKQEDGVNETVGEVDSSKASLAPGTQSPTPAFQRNLEESEESNVLPSQGNDIVKVTQETCSNTQLTACAGNPMPRASECSPEPSYVLPHSQEVVTAPVPPVAPMTTATGCVDDNSLGLPARPIFQSSPNCHTEPMSDAGHTATSHLLCQSSETHPGVTVFHNTQLPPSGPLPLVATALQHFEDISDASSYSPRLSMEEAANGSCAVPSSGSADNDVNATGTEQTVLGGRGNTEGTPLSLPTDYHNNQNGTGYGAVVDSRCATCPSSCGSSKLTGCREVYETNACLGLRTGEEHNPFNRNISPRLVKPPGPDLTMSNGISVEQSILHRTSSSFTWDTSSLPCYRNDEGSMRTFPSGQSLLCPPPNGTYSTYPVAFPEQGEGVCTKLNSSVQTCEPALDPSSKRPIPQPQPNDGGCGEANKINMYTGYGSASKWSPNILEGALGRGRIFGNSDDPALPRGEQTSKHFVTCSSTPQVVGSGWIGANKKNFTSMVSEPTSASSLPMSITAPQCNGCMGDAAHLALPTHGLVSQVSSGSQVESTRVLNHGCECSPSLATFRPLGEPVPEPLPKGAVHPTRQYSNEEYQPSGNASHTVHGAISGNSSLVYRGPPDHRNEFGGGPTETAVADPWGHLDSSRLSSMPTPLQGQGVHRSHSSVDKGKFDDTAEKAAFTNTLQGSAAAPRCSGAESREHIGVMAREMSGSSSSETTSPRRYGRSSIGERKTAESFAMGELEAYSSSTSPTTPVPPPQVANSQTGRALVDPWGHLDSSRSSSMPTPLQGQGVHRSHSSVDKGKFDDTAEKAAFTNILQGSAAAPRCSGAESREHIGVMAREMSGSSSSETTSPRRYGRSSIGERKTVESFAMGELEAYSSSTSPTTPVSPPQVANSQTGRALVDPWGQLDSSRSSSSSEEATKYVKEVTGRFTAASGDLRCSSGTKSPSSARKVGGRELENSVTRGNSKSVSSAWRLNSSGRDERPNSTLDAENDLCGQCVGRAGPCDAEQSESFDENGKTCLPERSKSLGYSANGALSSSEQGNWFHNSALNEGSNASPDAGHQSVCSDKDNHRFFHLFSVDASVKSSHTVDNILLAAEKFFVSIRIFDERTSVGMKQSMSSLPDGEFNLEHHLPPPVSSEKSSSSGGKLHWREVHYAASSIKCEYCLITDTNEKPFDGDGGEENSKEKEGSENDTGLVTPSIVSAVISGAAFINFKWLEDSVRERFLYPALEYSMSGAPYSIPTTSGPTHSNGLTSIQEGCGWIRDGYMFLSLSNSVLRYLGRGNASIDSGKSELVQTVLGGAIGAYGLPCWQRLVLLGGAAFLQLADELMMSLLNDVMTLGCGKDPSGLGSMDDMEGTKSVNRGLEACGKSQIDAFSVKCCPEFCKNESLVVRRIIVLRGPLSGGESAGMTCSQSLFKQRLVRLLHLLTVILTPLFTSQQKSGSGALSSSPNSEAKSRSVVHFGHPVEPSPVPMLKLRSTKWLLRELACGQSPDNGE
uniref:Uncharacterized protein TCIL3000_10_3150 n=1 Tax=Trypanosoma congolense (strain IL3000) TaxID=1068625 RepID=G0UVY8_TRYCI|nr:unnamed protein product [Trypanosoma congolense IL3000]